MLARLFGQHQQHRAIVAAQQLAIEEISADRVRHRDAAFGHLNGGKAGHATLQRRQQRRLIDERPLMEEERFAVADRNNVIMKHPLVDDLRVLLGKDGVALVKLMQPGNGLARLQRLARGITSRRDAAVIVASVNKELQAAFAILGTEAVMVRGPFVAEQRHLRQRVVHVEMLRIAKDSAQQPGGLRRLHGAMEFVVQVGDGEMHAPVGAVGRGRHRRRVGHPHRRGGADR